MPELPEHEEVVSPLTLNRLSFYLRCLRHLQEQGMARISSQELARRYHLSATQIRKDLAQFGEFGIRGVGYEVDLLAEHLNSLLGLDRRHALLIVGMGNLGCALARYLGFNYGSFQVVAGVDNDPKVVGRKIGDFIVRHTDELPQVVVESGAEIGVLAVPAEAAQQNYDALADAGIRGILNFAPVRVKRRPEVPLKNVDLRINLEELAFFLREPK
ncbi:MAG: redox-sensing transcriptional repressor [Acidobacteriota bacterium]|jgi:redox-sensing transcriptional repressor|nr:redox-sensing transcriptional repressor [Acidobacteriota bacterium]